MATCRSCGIAPLAEGDRHCFLCGDQLRRLEMVLTPAELVGSPESSPQVVAAVVSNKGQFGERVRVLPPNIRR